MEALGEMGMMGMIFPMFATEPDVMAQQKLAWQAISPAAFFAAIK